MNMRIIRGSVSNKYIAFAVALSVFLCSGYFIASLFGIDSLPTLSVFWSSLFILFVVTVFFYLSFFLPLMSIAREVRLMLTGKEFHKIKPSTIDEIGVFTYFFNRLASNLEQISDDLDNSKRLISELDVAKDIQRDVLPKEAPTVDGLDIVANTISASEMGGDSFDILQYKSDTYLYVGDVTGHGVPAALVMMMVNTLLTAFGENGMNSKDMIVQTNKILLEKISTPRFMTLLMLRWEEKRKKLYWLGAGHEYMLVYRAKTKTVESVKGGGVALRMAPNIENLIEEKALDSFEPGDVVLLYTDGITEGKNSDGDMYTVERLIQSFQTHGHKATAVGIFDAISKDFANFILDAPQEDDITLIITKRIADGQRKRNPINLSIKSFDNTKEKEEKEKNKWSWDAEKMH